MYFLYKSFSSSYSEFYLEWLCSKCPLGYKLLTSLVDIRLLVELRFGLPSFFGYHDFLIGPPAGTNFIGLNQGVLRMRGQDHGYAL